MTGPRSRAEALIATVRADDPAARVDLVRVERRLARSIATRRWSPARAAVVGLALACAAGGAVAAMRVIGADAGPGSGSTSTSMEAPPQVRVVRPDARRVLLVRPAAASPTPLPSSPMPAPVVVVEAPRGWIVEHGPVEAVSGDEASRAAGEASDDLPAGSPALAAPRARSATTGPTLLAPLPARGPSSPVPSYRPRGVRDSSDVDAP